MAERLMSRGDFLGLERVVHLASGGEAPMLRAGVDALQRFATDKGMGYVGGYSGRRHFYETYASAKAGVGRLLGCDQADIALLGSASEGIGVAAAGIDFRPGDNVVTVAGEFPSVSLPWLRLRSNGVEVREVDPSPDLPLDALIDQACDGRTRAIAVSHVGYLTGERVDLEALSQAARRRGVLLLLDASHSLGVLPVEAAAADFVVSACYKFMLATHGVGICFWNRNRLPEWQQDRLGWHSVQIFPPEGDTIDLKAGAARFETGNPAFSSLYVLEAAVAYLLRRGAARLEQHVLSLGSDLHRGLARLGLMVTTPMQSARRGPNICFAHPEADALTAKLRLAGIYVWGGMDRVRVSMHGFNDEDDLAELLRVLKGLLGR